MSKQETPVLYFNLSEGAILPTYKTKGSSGFDLHANLVLKPQLYGDTFNSRNPKNPTENSIILKPNGRALIKTGLKPMNIPDGYEIQIRPRSGVSLQKGLLFPNSIGTIDNDYRGDMGIIVSNHTKERIVIRHGDRIAQGVLCPIMQVSIIDGTNITDVKFEETERGENGFGSTGNE